MSSKLPLVTKLSSLYTTLSVGSTLILTFIGVSATASTSIVLVIVSLHSVPSLTLKSKLTFASLFSAGVNTTFPALISSTLISSPSLTSTPLTVITPATGSETI